MMDEQRSRLKAMRKVGAIVVAIGAGSAAIIAASQLLYIAAKFLCAHFGGDIAAWSLGMLFGPPTIIGSAIVLYATIRLRTRRAAG